MSSAAVIENEVAKPRSQGWENLVPYAISVALVLLFYSPWLMPNSSLHMGDYDSYFIPARTYASMRLRQGDLPQWTDAIAGGFPLLSDLQVGTFYPGNLLLAASWLDTRKAWVMDSYVILHVALMAAGAVFLGRSLGFSRTASLLVSVVVTFNTYMVNHLGQMVIIQLIAVGVWAMGCHVRGVKRAVFDDIGSPQSSLRWAVAAGLLYCSTVLLGHPQTTLYLFVIAGGGVGLLSLLWSMRNRSGKVFPGLIVVLPFVIAVAGASVQLLPTRVLLQQGGRYFGDMTPAIAMAGSFTPRQFPALLFPGFYYRAFPWIAQDHPQAILLGFWGIDGGHVAMGLTAFSAGLFGWLVNLRRVAAHMLVVVTITALILCAGKYTPLYPWLFDHVRLFHTMRIPSRIVWVVCFAWVLLGAMGISALVRCSRNTVRRASWAMILGLVIGLLSLCIFVWWRSEQAGSFASALKQLLVPNEGRQPPAEELVRAVVSQSIVGGLVALLLVIGFAALARSASQRSWRGERTQLVFGSFLVGLCFLELLLFGFHKNIKFGYTGIPVPDRLVHSACPEKPVGRIIPYNLSWNGRNWGMINGPQCARGYMGFVINSMHQFLPPEALTAGLYELEHKSEMLNISHAVAPARGLSLPIGNRIETVPDVGWIELARQREGTPMEARWASAATKSVRKVHVISTAAQAAVGEDGLPLAILSLLDRNGEILTTAPIRLGFETAEWAHEEPKVKALVKHRQPKIAFVKPLVGYYPKGVFYHGIIDAPTSMPVGSVRISTTEEGRGTYLCVSHVLLEHADNTSECHTGLESTGAWIIPNRDNSSKVFVIERNAAPGNVWMVPTANAVSYADDYIDVLKALRQPQNSPRKIIFLDAAKVSPSHCQELCATSPENFQGNARVKKDRPEEWTIRTYSNQSGFLVISNAYYPGWSARVDKEPVDILRANGGLQAIPIPAGQHKVKLEFSTPGLKAGGLISLFVWLACLLFLFIPKANRCVVSACLRTKPEIPFV